MSRVCLVCQNIDCKSRGSEQLMVELTTKAYIDESIIIEAAKRLQ